MGVSSLVEHIRIVPSHLGYNDVRRFNLPVDPLEDALEKNLFVDARAIRSDGLTRRPDSELVDISELLGKAHHDKNERSVHHTTHHSVRYGRRVRLRH